MGRYYLLHINVAMLDKVVRGVGALVGRNECYKIYHHKKKGVKNNLRHFHYVAVGMANQGGRGGTGRQD
jgi:hypothetical protein